MLAFAATATVWALILAAAAADETVAGDQKLIMLPTMQYNATCSDGSPVGFYFRPAPPGGQRNKVTLWLKGGAMCSDYQDCLSRKSKNLGSSKYWLPTHEGVAIQSPNKTENPDFFDWNHIYLEYCNGDFWVGTSPKPVNPWPGQGEEKFVFAGQLHLSQVIDEYLSKEVYGQAPEEFILTGGSAGGIGTIVNADWLAARLPATTKFRAMPQGGFFGQHLDDFQEFVSNTTHPLDEDWPSWFLNLDDGRYIGPAEKRCIADHGQSKRVVCMSPFWMYPYTTAPMFLVQAAVDYEQVFEFSGAPTREVFTNSTVAAYVKYSHGVQAGNLRTTIVKGSKTATDGLFGPACLGHTTSQMGWLGTARVLAGGDGAGHGHGGVPVPFPLPGTNPQVDGMWPAQAFSDWYFGRGGSVRNHMHLDANDDLTTLCGCYTEICGPKPMLKSQPVQP
jgi:hypothetical protein